MYSVLEVKKVDTLWYMYCVKTQEDVYRYYGIVYETNKDYWLVTLLDTDLKRIDHFEVVKTLESPAQVFLSLCMDYDEFYFPEAYQKNMIDTEGQYSYNT